MSVGTHRDVVGCHSGFQYRLHAVSRRADRAGAARGDVDVAAGKTEFDGALEDIGVTRAVRRTDVLNRHAALDALKQHIERTDDVAQVNVQYAEFACHHGTHANLREQAHHFFLRGEA